MGYHYFKDFFYCDSGMIPVIGVGIGEQNWQTTLNY